ncbi:MAG: DUF2157 domain-containing protein [bacterium JZ-2024 1]
MSDFGAQDESLHEARNASCGSGDHECAQWVAREVGIWVHERLISEKQARLILMRYGLIPGESAGTARRRDLIFYVSILGAVLVGIGIILVVAANWNVLSPFARLLFWLVITAGLYVIAYRLGLRTAMGKAFTLIGSLAFGASLFVVAQVYHFSERASVNILGLWALFVFPMAYAVFFSPHIYLSLIVALIYLATIWLSSYPGAGMPETLGYLLAIGTLVYLVGVFHHRFPAYRALAHAYASVGAVLMTTLVFLMSFRGFWSEAFWHSRREPGALAVWAGLLVFLLALGNLGLVLKKSGDLEEALMALACATVSLALMFFLRLPAGSADFRRTFSFVALGGVNLILFAGAIRLIYLGVARLNPGFVNYGLSLFFILMVARYFELFGTLLSTGLSFILGGAVLLLLGYGLTKQRAHLFRMIEAGAHRTAQ